MSHINQSAQTGGCIFQSFGVVRRKLDEHYEVETDFGLIRARRAAGCLLKPEIQDKVLVAADADDGGYILSVLERSGKGNYRLTFDRDATFETPAGGMRFIAGKDLSLAAPDIAVQAEQSDIDIEKTTWTGGTLTAGVDRIRVLTRTLDASAERMVQRVRRSYRFVEELEQACLGRLRCLVDGSLFMKGKNTSMVAEDKVKLDADSIELG